MARTPKPRPIAVLPSTSAFDLLEGEFARSQRTRRVSLGIAGVTVLTVAALTLTGVNDILTERSEQAALAAAEEANRVAVARLAEIDTAGGISADRLNAHVNERAKAYRAAVAGEIDVVALTRAIEASAPVGVVVNAVEFSTIPSGAVVNTAPAGGTSPAATAPSTPKDGDVIGSVLVRGTAEDFALIGAWAESVGRIPGIDKVTPSWSGGGDAVVTTLEARILLDGQTQRSARLADITEGTS